MPQSVLATIRLRATVSCILAVAAAGSLSALRAENPSTVEAGKFGALTLKPTDSPVSANWLQRASALPQSLQAQAQRELDLRIEERAARNAGNANRAAGTSAVAVPTALTPPPAAVVEDAPPILPDRVPADYFAGYGTRDASTFAPSFYHRVDSEFLTAPVAARAERATPAPFYASVTPTSTTIGYQMSGRSLYQSDNGLPTNWNQGAASPFRTEVSTPAAYAAYSASPAAPMHPGGFTDLNATAPVQVHPQPMLAPVSPEALPAGQFMYITDLADGAIRTAPTAGGTTTVYKTPGGTSDFLAGISFFGGNLFVANNSSGVIYKVVVSTGVVSSFANLGNGPTALVTDAVGNVYVALSSTNVISKITPGGVVSTFATLPSGSTPFGLAFDKNGILYSANQGNGTISKITTSGAVSTFVTISSSTLGGLAFNAAGNLFAADETSGAIYQITTSGVVSTYANVGTTEQPIGLIFDRNGILYAAGGNNILQITTGGVVSSFAPDNGSSTYLVIVPEPSTYLGGTLMLAAAFLVLRRRVCIV